MQFRKSREISGHAAGVYSLAFDGTYVYSASADKFVARWKVDEGIQDKFAIKFEQSVYSICLFHEAQYLAVGLSNGDLHFFDLSSRKELKFYQQHKTALFALCENPSKKHLYAADSDGNLSVWNTETLDLLTLLPFDCGKIRRIALDSTGEHIALCGQDGFIRILDTTFFNEKSSFKAHDGGVTSALFHPLRDEFIFTGGKDAHVRLWNFNTGEMLKSIPAHNYVIYELIALNHGKTLVSASRDKTIKIWNLDSLSFLQKLDRKVAGHKHSVNCLTKLDESTFASGSDDKQLVIWDGEEEVH